MTCCIIFYLIYVYSLVKGKSKYTTKGGGGVFYTAECMHAWRLRVVLAGRSLVRKASQEISAPNKSHTYFTLIQGTMHVWHTVWHTYIIHTQGEDGDALLTIYNEGGRVFYTAESACVHAGFAVFLGESEPSQRQIRDPRALHTNHT